MPDDYVFLISQIGGKDSPERERADEVHDGIVVPAAEKHDLGVIRSDHEQTPGQLTAQIVKSLLGARIVVADLTGRNPNVYYELGVAHAYFKPVIILIDKASNLSFDTQNERVIEIHDTGRVGFNQAKAAALTLSGFMDVVMADGYEVENLLSSVATARSLDALVSNDATAETLAEIRDGVNLLKAQFKKGFKFEATMFHMPEWAEVLKSLPPMPRALMSAAEFARTGHQDVSLTLPNELHCSRCMDYEGDLREALRKATGVDWVVHFYFRDPTEHADVVAPVATAEG